MSGMFGGGGQNIVNETPRISGLRIQTSCYGVAVPVVIGRQRCTGNLIYYNDLQAIRHEQQQSSGGGGGGGKGGGGGATQTNVTYTYRYTLQVGICEGPVSVGEVWMVVGSDKLRLSQNTQYGYVVFPGSIPNGYSSVLVSRHPDQFFYYPGLANFTAVDLGEFSNDSVPSFSFEVFGANYDASIDGADPAYAISSIITNSRWGASAPAARFPVATNYGNYAVAMGWKIGIEMAEQKQAADWVNEILQQTNSAAVWAADHLTVIPYGDAAVSGNGRSWTPDVSPLYDLTDDEFLGDPERPIEIIRKGDSETYNIRTVEFRDVSNEFNIETVDGSDPASVAMYGPKKSKDTLKAHGIGNSAAAARLGTIDVQRQSLTRNEYRFTLPWIYDHLLPMDIVTLTDAVSGMNRYPVRLTRVVDTADGEINCVAEDFPAGAGHLALYPRENAAGWNKDYNATPANIATPAFIESDKVDASRTGLRIGIAVTPLGTEWGGCDIYSSLDGVTYTLMKRWQRGARYGTLANSISADKNQVANVRLVGAGGTMTTVTQTASDALQTLCVIDEEYLGYSDATLTGTNAYSLKMATRGALNTDAATHAAGKQFVRVDESIAWSDEIDQSMIGQTLYFKFCSFNQYGGAVQELETAVVYPYTVTGWPLVNVPPANVTSFVVDHSAKTFTLTWTDITEVDIAGYQIRWINGDSRDWGSAAPIHEGYIRFSPYVSAVRPAGMGTLMIKAVDRYGNESRKAAALVVNLGDVPVDNVVETVDMGARGFTGIVTDGAVIGGEVLANEQGTMWNPNELAAMWHTDSDLMWRVATYYAMTYVDEFQVPVACVGSQMTLPAVVNADSWRLEYRRLGAAVMWGDAGAAMWHSDTSAMWSIPAFATWPGSLVAENDSYEIRLSTSFGGNRGAISSLVASFDVPDVMETLLSVAIPAAGLRLPITKSYHKISVVNVQLIAGTGTAFRVIVVDKNETLGPLLTCQDISGNPVDGLADVTIQGY